MVHPEEICLCRIKYKAPSNDLTVEPTCYFSVLQSDCCLGTGEGDVKLVLALFSGPCCLSLHAIHSSFPTGGKFKEKPWLSEQAEGFALKASDLFYGGGGRLRGSVFLKLLSGEVSSCPPLLLL